MATTLNIPLLRQVMEHVAAHPDKHDQSYWGYSGACGTTRCIAGWANFFAGYEETWSAWTSTASVVDLVITDTVITDTARVNAGGRDPGEAAADVLGLDPGDANALFYADDLDEVWRVVEEITHGAITRAEVEASVARGDIPRADVDMPPRELVSA